MGRGKQYHMKMGIVEHRGYEENKGNNSSGGGFKWGEGWEGRAEEG